MRSLQLFIVFTLIVGFLSVSTAEVQQVESLVMIDATGKTIGPIVEISGSYHQVPIVPFKVGKMIFVLSVFKDRFGGSGNPVNLYFTSKGCDGKSGQVVAALDEIATRKAARDEMFWSYVGADGGTAYVPTRNTKPIQSVKILSRLYVEPNGDVECQDYPKFIPTAVPATQLPNMLTMFTPPFSVGVSSGN